ncbi:hypothetical protein HMPREF3232_01085, partial [Fannyhessea vaginae]
MRALALRLPQKNRQAGGLMNLGHADDNKERLLSLLCLFGAFSRA